MNKKWMAVILMISILVLFPMRGLTALGDETQDFTQEFQRETKCSSVSVVTYDHGVRNDYGEEEGLWQIGSMTKAFTGLAIQKLIHEGVLSEEDLVSDYLPEFEVYYQGKGPIKITIGQLLRQTSGFTNSEAKYPSAKEGESLQEWVKRISGKSVQTTPGSEYAYSNVNYNLLGAVIEVVSGESYREYMEREVLMPLGLSQTYVGEPDKEDTAAPKVIKGGRLLFRKAISYALPVREGAIPAGYFYSSASDMARWMEIWIGTAEIPAEYQEVIGEVKSKLQKKGDYYAGWECFGDGVIGHSGGTPNYSSRIVFSDGEGLGTCVLTNLNVAASTDSLCNGIFDRMRGQGTGRIASDVWTVFDKIFSCLCILAFFAFLICIWCKKRGILMVMGSTCAVLFAALVISLPLIFGASLLEIVVTWAPLSLAVFLGALTLDALTAVVRWWMLRDHENHKKTGEGTAAHGDH
ncbi:MAG: beta-lactamase family protein [Lachnospiraceae bacterium]|nr:beta-lactamase family protein [Lachnospiraceae bacterium]